MEDVKKQVQEFFESPDPTLMRNDLHQAAFTMSELGLWSDYVDSVSAQQIIQCWKIVEKLRTTKFPRTLWM